MKQDTTHLAGLTKWKTRDHYKGKQKNRALTDVVDKKKKRIQIQDVIVG